MALPDADLENAGITEQDINTAIRVLEHFEMNPHHRSKARDSDLIRRLFKSAMSGSRCQDRDDRKEQRKKRKRNRKDEDNFILEDTGIRKLRSYRQNTQLNGGSMPVLVPSLGEMMQSLEDCSGRLLCDQQGFASNDGICADQVADGPSRTLAFAKSCHICHESFSIVHHFYDQLCPRCSDLNFSKRLQTIDLSGKVALVTGGRVKIGYCVALKLLRSGCYTIVTSRFPRDAVQRYRQEKDYAQWKDRLKIYGLDFRDIPMVHAFCQHIKGIYTKLDIIINNAAQTVRRPPAYYKHLIKFELDQELNKDFPEIVVYSYYQPRRKFSLLNGEYCGDGELLDASTACSSVLLSQVPLIPDDKEGHDLVFPAGILDSDLQQVDLRSKNSWTQRLGEISAVEMIECHAINSFSPFIINSELKVLLSRRCDEVEQLKRQRDGTYIVNVSAMEGQFYRHKTPFHPHTNMAKASLNMLTRTSAQDLVQEGIYMNSVDTGWITDENPVNMTKMYTPEPLDEWDAAMRILDPVFTGIRDPSQRHYGVFFKNYSPTRW